MQSVEDKIQHLNFAATPSGLLFYDGYGPAAKTAGYTLSLLSWLKTLK